MSVVRSRWVLKWMMLAVLIGTYRPVAAFERTDVLDAFDKNDPFDAALSVRYEWLRKTSRVTREQECLPTGNGAGTTCGTDGNRATIRRFNELSYQGVTHTMWIDLRIGLYHDFELYLGLPFVISKVDRLSFGPGVDAGNSTVYTANSTTDLLDLSTGTYTGPSRAGFGDMLLGLRAAPLAYERHPEYPDWVVGTEVRFPTGDVRSGSNSSVGSGIYEWKLYTDISRRVFDFFEIYFGLWGTLRFAAGDTLFKDYGEALNGTQDQVAPGSTLGIQTAVNFIPWQVPKEERKVQIELGFHTWFNFEGRDYTELFEGLAHSPCRDNPACGSTKYYRNAVLDGSIDTTGITDYQQYAVFGGWLGVSAQPIKWVNIGLTFTVSHEQPHFITFADIGKDLPDDSGLKDGVIDRPQVPSGLTPEQEARFQSELPYHPQNEYNPVYVENYDLIGHRFYSERALILNLMLNLSGKF